MTKFSVHSSIKFVRKYIGLNKVVKTKVMKSSYLLGPFSNVKFFGFITFVNTVDKKEPHFLFSSMNN